MKFRPSASASLLARAAVIGQPLNDYTPQLYKDLGIENVKEDELRAKLAQYAAARPAPAATPEDDSPLGRAYSACSFKVRAGGKP